MNEGFNACVFLMVAFTLLAINYAEYKNQIECLNNTIFNLTKN